jgi:hypothetical protein
MSKPPIKKKNQYNSKNVKALELYLRETKKGNDPKQSKEPAKRDNRNS